MKIVLPRHVVGLWKSELGKAGRREIGGVLLGEAIGDEVFRVVEVSVQRTGGTASSFVRDPEHSAQAIRAFFDKTGHDYRRFNYLGEWHSHPSFATKPSTDDVQAMGELLAEGRIGATFACLVIVRRKMLRRLDIGAYVFEAGGAMAPVRAMREP